MPTHSRADLIHLGYGDWAPHVLRGALESDARTSFSDDDIEQAVASWLTTPETTVPSVVGGFRSVVLPVGEVPADGEVVIRDAGEWVSSPLSTLMAVGFRGPWAPSTTYKARELVIAPSSASVRLRGRLVSANADFTSAGSFVASNWTLAEHDEYFQGAWTASTTYLAGQVVSYLGQLYSANADFTSGASFLLSNWTPLSTQDASAVVVTPAGTLTQTNVQAALAGLAVRSDARALRLVPTTVKTASYAAAVSDYVPVDTTSGPVTITLPTAPPDGTVVGVKMVTLGAGNTVTIALGGADVLNRTGGVTSMSLLLLNQGVLLQYAASAGVWYVEADDLPLSQLDTRFPAAARVTTLEAAPPPIPAANHCYIGAYASMQAAASHEAAMIALETSLGRTLDISHEFYEFLDSTWPATFESNAIAAGRYPLCTWKGGNLAAITSGVHDATITAAALRCKAFGKPMFLRFAHEMNLANANTGVWSPGNATNGADPGEYRRMWRRVWRIFKAQGVRNVAWVWCPNVNDSPRDGGNETAFWNNWRHHYPGDEFVDWLATDGYQAGNGPLAGGGPTWSWGNQIFGSILADFASGMGGLTTGKPIMIAEWGVYPTPESRPHAITDTAGWFKQQGVKALLYFHTDSGEAVGGGNALSDAASLAVFKTVADDAHYGGTSIVGRGYVKEVIADAPYMSLVLGSIATANVTDQGTGLNHGTINQAPVRGAPSKYPGAGGGMSFKGQPTNTPNVNGYLALPTIPSLGTALQTGLTIEFTIKPDPYVTTLKMHPFGSTNTDFTTIDMVCNASGSANTLTAGATNFVWKASGNGRTTTITTNIYDGLEHHIVWKAKPGSAADEVFVDGVSVTVATAGTTPGSGFTALGQAFFVGDMCYQGGVSGSPFVGQMTNRFNVYKTLLSSARIAAHYAALTT